MGQQPSPEFFAGGDGKNRDPASVRMRVTRYFERFLFAGRV